MMFNFILAACLFKFAIAVPSPKPSQRTQYAPPPNQTYLNIGQNYVDEWNSFSSEVKVPAGISVYGDIYDGILNPDSQTLLEAYAAAHNGIVEIGLSWKDDMISHGYTIYQGAKLCDDIAGGKYDSSLQTLSTYLSEFPSVKFLLRVDYEVSGNLHANTDPNAFVAATFDTTAYPKAFAHVRSIISGAVKNVDFVYHSVRGGAELLYPGDDVVDWLGFSIFNNDVCLAVGPTTNCLGSSLDPNVLKDIQFATKPKWIAESTPQPPVVGDSDSFINYLTLVHNMIEQYDFQGWTYINSLWTAHGWDAATWGDSRIESNAPVKAWFEENIVNNQRYIFG